MIEQFGRPKQSTLGFSAMHVQATPSEHYLLYPEKQEVICLPDIPRETRLSHLTFISRAHVAYLLVREAQGTLVILDDGELS